MAAARLQKKFYEIISGDKNPQSRADVGGHIMSVHQNIGGKTEKKSRKQCPPSANQFFCPNIDKNYQNQSLEASDPNATIELFCPHRCRPARPWRGFIPHKIFCGGFIKKLSANLPLTINVVLPSRFIGWEI